MNHRISTLIADDHPVFRRGLREIFEEDHRFDIVAEAADGAEALGLIHRIKPAVAVLDIRMPRLTGLQVAREIWQAKSGTGIVLLTSHTDVEFFDEAMSVGVLGYVLKENTVVDILAAVENVASGRVFISQSIAARLVGRHTQQQDFEERHKGMKSLSPMERRILRLIATDKTSKEIADELKISVRTVDTHRQNISQKLDLRGSHSLLKFAFDHRQELSQSG